MEVQFYKGTVNVPGGGSESKPWPELVQDIFHGSERRKPGKQYLVYLQGRTTAELFRDYAGFFAYQSPGGWFFYDAEPVKGQAASKVFIPFHRIVRIEVSG